MCEYGDEMPIEHLMLGTSILLLASVIAKHGVRSARRPALLVFLVVGMLAGPDGQGGINFDYAYAETPNGYRAAD